MGMENIPTPQELAENKPKSKVSVQKALSILSRIDSKITNVGMELANSIFFVHNEKEKINGVMTPDEAKKKASELKLKLDSLIKTRSSIREAIYQSNAVTKLKIAGREMTVAEAIANKETFKLLDPIMQRIKTLQRNAQSVLANKREAVEKEASDKLGKTDKMPPDEVAKLIKVFTDNKNFILTEAIDSSDIDKLETYWREFAEEVDTCIVECNSITLIEID